MRAILKTPIHGIKEKILLKQFILYFYIDYSALKIQTQNPFFKGQNAHLQFFLE